MHTTLWQRAAVAAVLVTLPLAAAVEPNRAGKDVEALVAVGPRVAGTPAMERASAYLISEYRKAGYVAEVRTFTYPKFEDLGSSLTVGGQTLGGQAIQGSPAGRPAARLVAVPNVGRPEDFAGLPVRGTIAIVRRGDIRFGEKARNAAAAGAAGLIIVNTQPGELLGTLGEEVSIPVLGLSGERGGPLLERARTAAVEASLNVNTRRGTVTGRNVVAFMEGVTRPGVLLGGHYDSVLGSPGANDNASGTAVVLEIARSLQGTPLARQAWFVSFDGEEDGLRGSQAFVGAASPEFLRGLKGMLNFDMVGVNDRLLAGGSTALVELTQSIDRSVGSFNDRSGSDHAPFLSANVPAVFFYRGQEPNYHQPTDTRVEPRLLDATARVGLELVQRLLAAQ